MTKIFASGLSVALLLLDCGGSGGSGGGAGGAGSAGDDGGDGGARCYHGDPTLCDPAASCPSGTIARVCESPIDLRPPGGECALSPPACVAAAEARLFCCPARLP